MGAHLDLDAIRPANSTFTHRGRRYEIPAELAVETIVEALQLREMFELAERADDEQAQIKAMESLRGIVWGLIDEAGGDLDSVPATLDAEVVLALEAAPVGSSLKLPDGTIADVVSRDPGGTTEIRVAKRAYPRLSIEEITAVLTLAMGGAAGETPEDVAKRAIEGGPDEEVDRETGEDPTASNGSSPPAPVTVDEIEPAAI